MAEVHAVAGSHFDHSPGEAGEEPIAMITRTRRLCEGSDPLVEASEYGMGGFQ
jgi:hypothetical protein